MRSFQTIELSPHNLVVGTLMIILSQPPVERRFRVAFKDGVSQTGAEACAESAKQLSKYITVNATEKERVSNLFFYRPHTWDG